jgi:hypothetical protein
VPPGTPLTTPLDRDRLLRFFANAGFKVHRTANAGWYEAGPRFLLGVPTHMPLAIDAAEARAALRATGALGVRYVSARPTEGADSWQMIASGADYDLEKFSGNTRSKVRRGLKNNEIRRISGDELMRTGEQAFLDTVKRQGRADRYGIDRWHALLRAADADSGIEIWAAWHEGVMAAYLLTMVFADNCELYEARSRDDTLKHYPNNALIYHVTRHLLVERGLPQVTFGIEGLEELESLDQFKLALGFYKKPVRQRVVFHPLLRTALGLRPVRSALDMLAERKDGSAFWRRARGLLPYAEITEKPVPSPSETPTS